MSFTKKHENLFNDVIKYSTYHDFFKEALEKRLEIPKFQEKSNKIKKNLPKSVEKILKICDYINKVVKIPKKKYLDGEL